MKDDIITAFYKHVNYCIADGMHSYSCTKGLWSVSCANRYTAMSDALHYFKQYYGDGEYENS